MTRRSSKSEDGRAVYSGGATVFAPRVRGGYALSREHRPTEESQRSRSAGLAKDHVGFARQVGPNTVIFSEGVSVLTPESSKTTYNLQLTEKISLLIFEAVMSLSKRHLNKNEQDVPFDIRQIGERLQERLPEVSFALLMGSACDGVVVAHSDFDLALYLASGNLE